MGGDNDGMGNVMLKEFARAVPWGIVILNTDFHRWLNRHNLPLIFA